MTREQVWMDGNEAVAHVAYRVTEVMAIYPITPASAMGELADEWASQGMINLWGQVPQVVEMQSESGAAGVVHGALQAGSLTTTFTASQGLLLMLPNLYKIAGELNACVIHVASRALATSALSIFGDHSDVMATRGSGCGLFCSASVQEAADFAAIATASSLIGRVPLIHFFDGFRTSHEIQRVENISDATLRALMPTEAIAAHRSRGLSPDQPVLRGSSMNPDVCFQAREAANPYYDAMAPRVQAVMDTFANLTGRQYHLFDYEGDPQAERVIVLMGSGCETAAVTVSALRQQGERVGLLKVRLLRPISAVALVQALPSTTTRIAVLDRCKEPGSQGEPLYLELLAAIHDHWPSQPHPQLVAGRFGLASKEFTPAMVKAVLDNLSLTTPKHHFTIGIVDDVTHHSLLFDPCFELEHKAGLRAVFVGLGSDGTVGATKNTLKIVGDATGLHGQGYFVYDSKKAGSVTVSHLRFSPKPIRSSHQIRRAQLLACHHWDVLSQFDLLDWAAQGGTLLLNSPFAVDRLWWELPERSRQQIQRKQLRVFAVNAAEIAQTHGLGRTINTVMQACFFAISELVPLENALAAMRTAIQHSYGHKGQHLVDANLAVIDEAIAQLHPIYWPDNNPTESPLTALPLAPGLAKAPESIRSQLEPQLQRNGDALPVSALPCDGTFPTATSQWEKRNIAEQVPVWDPDLCVQCGKCVMVCPHAVIRAKVSDPAAFAAAPEGFLSAPARDRQFEGQQFTLQISAEDCTGCSLCVDVCPARDRYQPRHKAINMAPQRPLREQSRQHWPFFLELPEVDRASLNPLHINQQQLQQPLFEFSGACAGCGETPYLKLVSQLFGDRMVVANATGCSSIYGGNLPTTPWSVNAQGRGPAWSNSLFEDNAEFGLGFRVAFDQRQSRAKQLLLQIRSELPNSLVEALLRADQADEAGIHEQRERVAALKQVLNDQQSTNDTPCATLEELRELADDLVRRSVWIVGGDGWAYDIGFGGLDHVLSTQKDVNVLVLDTEVYSNTGGQMSKATPKGAVAKFATGGKSTPKKDLGLIAMTYGHVYVASVAMGARDEHTLRAFIEAESYPGPSLILAYSHCIAHGIDMARGMAHQKQAVESGRWILYRHDPRCSPPLQLDSREPQMPLEQALETENRFRMLRYSHPQQAQRLMQEAQQELHQRWRFYQSLAQKEQR
jgi:pyruvate-ferredoxin/flavodoxin oxidoreductase